MASVLCIANLHGNYVNRICTEKLVNKGKLGNSAIGRSKV